MQFVGRVRVIDGNSFEERELVAQRMRLTLMEVVGEQAGRDLYTMDWLRLRVDWHLDPQQCHGQVFVAENVDGQVVGHTIVRVDSTETGQPVGLFSTTFVEPSWRARGVARRLLHEGESWMRVQGLCRAVTYTAVNNFKLKNLYLSRGYAVTAERQGFVELSRTLEGQP